jgi:hypothetical protein
MTIVLKVLLVLGMGVIGMLVAACGLALASYAVRLTLRRRSVTELKRQGRLVEWDTIALHHHQYTFILDPDDEYYAGNLVWCIANENIHGTSGDVGCCLKHAQCVIGVPLIWPTRSSLQRKVPGIRVSIYRIVEKTPDPNARK